MDNKDLNKYTGGFKRRGFRPSLLVVMVLLLLFETLSAFNFKAPYSSVTAWIDGTVVRYRVYDSSRGQWMEGYEAHNSTPSNLIARDGVVVYQRYDSMVFLVVYDPYYGEWVEEFESCNTISNLSNNQGVVAWVSGTSTVFNYVYDLSNHTWERNVENANTISNFINTDGVVTWVSGTSTVFSNVYDLSNHTWERSVKNTNTVSNFTSNDGVVAWQSGTSSVYYTVYDPFHGYWYSDAKLSYDISNISISYGTLYWLRGIQQEVRGYDYYTRYWDDNPTTPLASFVVSPVWQGNSGVYWVHFNDLSLGTQYYSWNFGDGGTSSEQCPLHVYTQPGVYTVSLSVYGPGGYNSTYQTVITDFEAPSGSIIIDNGDTETYSTSVTLTISATDDSGSVDSMRFSNDGSTWSSWEQYATSKSWTLSSGYGTKTVYAQFRDAAQNTSNSYSDTIDLLEIPTITVTSPNGGENWAVGSSYFIQWTSGGSVGNVRIDYSIDNGASWINIITSPSTDGNYLWTVPDNPSNNCRVRVMEPDGNPSDMSDGVFSILPPTITVTSPNGGEIFHVGSIQNITWNKTGSLASVQIDYSVNNGASWTNIAASTSNDGTHLWYVPDNVSSSCRIRVMDPDGSPSDMSDGVFSIVPPTITITSPNGGENMEIGLSYNITWTTAGAVGNVRIDYSIDAGVNWITIADSVYSSSGSYQWTIPDNPSSNCRVRVMELDGNPSDISDGVFMIVPAPTPSIAVTAPNGDENWYIGSSQNITWTSTWNVGNVQIDYSTDSGVSWTNIIASTSNDGSYTWTVPNNPLNTCRVRVMEPDGVPADTSDSDFTISTFEYAIYGLGAGTTGLYNSFFGVDAGQSNSNGDYNIFFGHQAGFSNTVGNGSLFLGYQAGYYETGSDKLYIANSNTDSPLIYGEFDNNKVTINGQLEVVRETESGKITARQGDGATAILAAGTNYGFFGTQSENDLRILANDSPKMTITTSGNVGIGTTSPIYTLTVTGSGGSNAGSTGGPWIAGSSREYKENIRELSSLDAIEALEELTPVRFNYKKSDEEYLGFIAEDVPALVAMNNRKGMNSMDVVAVLTKVLQEMENRDLDQQKTLSELNKIEQNQQKMLSELNKRISKLDKK